MPGSSGPVRQPRSWQLAVLVAILLAVFGGGIAVAVDRGSSSSDTSGRPASSATNTPTASAPASAAAPANADLFSPPAGYSWIPDASAGTGAITLDQATKLDGGANLSQANLQQLGFVRGMSRQWAGPTATAPFLVDVVYTFTQPGQASAYASAVNTARRADPGYSVITAPASAPAQSVLFTDPAGNLVIVFASGKHTVLMGLFASSTTGAAKPDPGQLAALAAGQASISAVS